MEGYTLTRDDELPVQQIPEVADWSENYAFIGYDFGNNIGFCAYIGRWVKNPKVFREQLYLYLPDGSILSHIAMGKPATRELITAGCLEFRCDEAGGRWRINFEGPMRQDTLARLRQEPVLQGHPQAVKFEVVIDHQCPTWMFPQGNNTTFGKFHYEQMGESRGRIDFQGQRLAFAAPTYRDHTRGPRNLSHYDGHIWLQLHFPEGTAFSTYQTWHNNTGQAEQVLNLGTSVKPGELREAFMLNAPRLRTLDDLLAPVTALVSLEGRELELVGKPVTTLAYSFTKDVEFYYGLVPSIADFYSIEQPILFEYEGGTVKGYMQRSGPFARKV